MWKENKLVKEKKSEGREGRRRRNSGRNDEVNADLSRESGFVKKDMI